jgi:hypothetical protein
MKTQQLGSMNRKRVVRTLKMMGRQNFKMMVACMRACRCAKQRKAVRAWLVDLKLPEWARQAMENRYFFGS